jgi:hypothetical protein
MDFWGPLAAGIVFILAGVAQLVKYCAFSHRAQRAPGVVIGMSETLTGRYGTSLYHPVLEFTTHEGRRVRTTMQVGSRPAPAQVGDQVIVAYDPHEPESAEISGTGVLRLVLSAAFVLGGLLFMCFAWL